MGVVIEFTPFSDLLRQGATINESLGVGKAQWRGRESGSAKQCMRAKKGTIEAHASAHAAGILDIYP
jgi:hypothetical protein